MFSFSQRKLLRKGEKKGEEKRIYQNPFLIEMNKRGELKNSLWTIKCLFKLEMLRHTHTHSHSDISGLRIVNSLNPGVSIKNVTHAKISNFDD